MRLSVFQHREHKAKLHSTISLGILMSDTEVHVEFADLIASSISFTEKGWYYHCESYILNTLRTAILTEIERSVFKFGRSS